MKKLYFSLLYLSFAQSLFSQSLFNSTLGNTGDDNATKLITNPLGNYLMLGNSSNIGGTAKGILTEFDVNGNLMSTKTLSGSHQERFLNVANTADGGYILCGQNQNAVDSNSMGDAFVMKLDANKNHEWARSYGRNSADKAIDVKQLDDGGYLVLGETYTNMGMSIFLIRTNPIGDTIWTKTYANEYYYRHYALEIDIADDGDYMVLAYFRDIEDGGATYLMKVSKDGNVLWAKMYSQATSLNGYGMCKANGGYMILTFYYVIRVNNDGNIMAYKKLPGTFPMLFFPHTNGETYSDISVMNDGNFLIPGVWQDKACLLKVDTMGNKIWIKGYGLNTSGVDDYFIAASQMPDNRIFAIGTTKSLGDSLSPDYWILATDGNGEIPNCFALPDMLATTNLMGSANLSLVSTAGFMVNTTNGFSQNINSDYE